MTTPSTPNWRIAGRAINPGQLWANLPIPGENARLGLHADGTPDKLIATNAFMLGATKAGAKLMVKPKYNQQYVDEFRSPIATSISEMESAIAAELVGVTDMDLVELLTQGFGTKTSGADFEQVTFGVTEIAFTSIAHIFPLADNPGLFGVWHLYKSLNDTGLEFSSGRKELGFTPVSFRAYEVTSRAKVDTFGSYWKQKV